MSATSWGAFLTCWAFVAPPLHHLVTLITGDGQLLDPIRRFFHCPILPSVDSESSARNRTIEYIIQYIGTFIIGRIYEFIHNDVSPSAPTTC
jgi:hypothetical protein